MVHIANLNFRPIFVEVFHGIRFKVKERGRCDIGLFLFFKPYLLPQNTSNTTF